MKLFIVWKEDMDDYIREAFYTTNNKYASKWCQIQNSKQFYGNRINTWYFKEVEDLNEVSLNLLIEKTSRLHDLTNITKKAFALNI